MQTYIVIVSGSILNVSTVHLNGIWHLIWRYLSKPVLGGHPVLSGHYSIPRGCPLNTGFTVSRIFNQATQNYPCQNFPTPKNPEIEKFEPQKILWSSLSLEIRSDPPWGVGVGGLTINWRSAMYILPCILRLLQSQNGSSPVKGLSNHAFKAV